MKYRRILLLLLLIYLLLTMSACAGTGSADTAAEPEPTVSIQEPSHEMDVSPEPEPSAVPSTELTDAVAGFPGLSPEQTAVMSNWAQYGFGLIENDIYYGRFFLKGEESPMLFSIELKSQKYDVKAGSWQVLDSEYSPKYMTKQGDTLYYIMLDHDSGKSLGIASMDTDGSNARVLYEGECDYLSIAGERLYFTDGENHPACIEKDGSGFRIILDRAVYYLFALDEDWIIFQDDADNESLHLFRLSDGADIKLTDEPGFYPVIRGTSLFFSARDPEIPGAYRLAFIDISSYTESYNDELNRFEPQFAVQYGNNAFGGEFYICGDTIRAMNGREPVDLSRWEELEDDAYNGFARIMRFVSDRWMIEEIAGKDSGITAIMFHDRSGGFASSIPWLN